MRQAKSQCNPSSLEMSSLENVKPGIRPLFFNQKIAQKLYRTEKHELRNTLQQTLLQKIQTSKQPRKQTLLCMIHFQLCFEFQSRAVPSRKENTLYTGKGQDPFCEGLRAVKNKQKRKFTN
jgi:hypothetical protein